MSDETKDEMIFLGGELDGLTMNVNDKTLPWPIHVFFEMMIDDGNTPRGADEIPTRVMKTRRLKYSLLNCGECPNGDAFVQYMSDGSEDCEYDFNQYSCDSSDPFHPDDAQ